MPSRVIRAPVVVFEHPSSGFAVSSLVVTCPRRRCKQRALYELTACAARIINCLNCGRSMAVVVDWTQPAVTHQAEVAEPCI